ncbi:uncharacterized protein LOC130704361 [Daphnia carinata]|uniref:uncharacterized protein LOC130704361 n=1 Tax=Daphnia carinata TaxID=120202 RepID=UPI002868BBBC|nr:uncharacterized protein LOC130704361 [Daphnia carinata]
MISRREDCKIIYSDNASTFTCAAKLISEDPTLANWLSSKGIKWKFSHSLAPWWGGFWERMVRSVKEPLRKVLGKMKVSYDQLHTILVENETIVNSRPLTYVSGDAQSFEVLSPQKLLTGRQPGATTESPDSTKMSRDELIELDKQRSEHALTWWRLWQDSYLSDLKRFYYRKGKGTRIPRVGEVVLLKEPNIKRVSWPKAIVTELVPGYGGKEADISDSQECPNIENTNRLYDTNRQIEISFQNKPDRDITPQGYKVVEYSPGYISVQGLRRTPVSQTETIHSAGS